MENSSQSKPRIPENRKAILADKIEWIKQNHHCREIYKQLWPELYREVGNCRCFNHEDGKSADCQVSKELAYCHVCGEKWDCIDLVMKRKGVSKAEAIAELYENVNIPPSPAPRQETKSRERNWDWELDAAIHTDPPQEVLDYFRERGILLQLENLISSGKVGFRKAGKYPPSAVFPLRNLDSITIGLQYINPKALVRNGLDKPLATGSRAKEAYFLLSGEGQPIIVGAIIDGLSVKAVLPNAHVVCTVSENAKGKFAPFAKETPVIFFDRDERGKRFTQEAVQELSGNCRVVNWDMAPEGCKDVNDLLTQGHTQIIGRMIEEATKPEVLKRKTSFFECTDLGNAERFADRFGSDTRYCQPWLKWLVYDGKRWEIDSAGKVCQFAKATVRGIKEESDYCTDEDRRKAVATWAKKSESRGKIESMVTLARWEKGIPIKPEDFDKDNWLFNLENGTVNLKTGTIKPNSRDDLITKISNFSWKKKAPCLTWLSFLNRIMEGKEDLIQFLQRAIGYSLTGSDIEQCIFLLYGTGANGKSTFLDVIKLLMGDYSRQAEFSTFLVRKTDTVRNDIADLRGSRFVAAIETEKGQKLAESIVKQMTGGEALKARFLFSEYFEFQPTFKIWLAANHKPTIKGTDHAIWRRIRLIPFTVTIPEGERDPLLRDKLKAELPGIFQWALDGCLAWQKEGLKPPQDVLEATKSYREEMDILGEFMADYCLIDQRCSISKSELYEAYETWCKENREEPIKKNDFGSILLERGFKDKRTTKARKWEGIGLLERKSATNTGNIKYDTMTHDDTLLGNLSRETSKEPIDHNERISREGCQRPSHPCHSVIPKNVNDLPEEEF